MGSVFEKLTYYDILGYLLPGMVFVIISGGAYAFSIGEDIVERYKDISGFLIMLFIVVSYVIGLILSEFSRIFMIIFDKIKLKMKHIERCYSFPVERSIIVKALKNSNLISGNEEDIKAEYFEVMYGVIQTDPKYGRIHNYTSAEIMYKNLMAAILASALIVFFVLQYKNFWFFIISIAIFLAFLNRYRRFYKKNNKNTVIVFV